MCNGSLRIPPADFCVPRRSPWPRRASVVGSGCGIYRRIAGSDRFASSLAASCISSGEWAPPVPNAGDSDADLKSKTHQNWGWAERKKKWNENTTTGSESLQIFTNSRTKCCLNKKICVKFSESVHYAYVCVWVRVSVCVCAIKNCTVLALGLSRDLSGKSSALWATIFFFFAFFSNVYF